MFTTNNEQIRRPGYTSNYTDEDRKNGVSLDFVFVIGTDNPDQKTHQEAYQQIILDCEAKGLKYVILGDGDKGANLKEIAQLPPTENVVIYGHGSARHTNHHISLTDGNSSNSFQTIHAIQAQTNCKNIFVCSCYGGKIIDDFKNNPKYKLQEGTFLSAYSAPDEVSWSDDAAHINATIIQHTTPGQSVPVVSLSADLIKAVPQTMVFAHQQGGQLESATLMRNSRHIYHQVEDFCEYQLRSYNHFINGLLMSEHGAQLKQTLTTEFPHVDFNEYIRRVKNNEVAKFLELNMSDEERWQFEANSIMKHILHKDTDVLKALLHSNPSVADHILETIKKPNPKQSKRYGGALRALLAHYATQEGNVDLTNCELSKADLTGLDLSHINLTNAKLNDADLTRANLTGVNLTSVDLTGAKGVTATMLLSAASLFQTNIDAQQFKAMTNDEQVSVKKKMADDYINHLNKIDNVFELTLLLNDIAKNETHPLKYKRIGLDDYGNTTSYAAVINHGRERLVALLSNERTLNQLTDTVRSSLTEVAKINVDSASESYLPSFLRSQPKEKSSADKLNELLAKAPTESVFEAISKIEELPENDRLPYAKKITNRIESADEITYILDLLPEQDRLPYVKFTADKVNDIKDVKSIMELLPEKDQLNYAILAREHVKNINDVISILRRLPAQDQLTFTKNILNTITDAEDLKWLAEQKISNETKKFLNDTIHQSLSNNPPKLANDSPKKADHHPTQSTTNIYAHLIHDEKMREKALDESSHHIVPAKTAAENKNVSPSTAKSTQPANDATFGKEESHSQRKMGH